MGHRVILFLLCCLLPATVSAETLEVREVQDGITIRLNDGRALRLIGIEDKEIPGGKAFLQQFLEGKALRTEIDAVNNISYHHDGKQRFLAYLYADEVLVNAELVRAGFGKVDVRSPFRYRDRFLALEKEANADNPLR